MSELSLQGFLTECEREQLHRVQSIQPQGCLLGGRTGSPIVRFASANLEDWVGRPLKVVLGQPIAALMPDFPPTTEIADLAEAEAADAWMRPSADKRLYPELFQGVKGALDGLLSCDESHWLLELEASLPASQRHEAYRPVSHRLYRMPYSEHDWATHCQYLADELRAASGFERVMVYRFREDGCGEVISESLVEGLPPYLGLRYPASDIPRIARDIYLLNSHRQIPDIDALPVPILDPDGDSLDLTLSDLRAVSPVHLEYLANMGVTASLSFSVRVAGELWGLVACHHRVPRHLPLPVRERCAEMVQVFTLAIAGYQSTRRMVELNESDQEITALLEALRQADSGQDVGVDPGLTSSRIAGPTLGEALMSLVDATGAALVDARTIVTFGQTPDIAAIRAMANWFNEAIREPIFATDQLSAHYPEAASLSGLASGLLAVRVENFRDQAERCFFWWRPEQPRAVHWAGDPRKSALFDAQRQRLSPRSSFERWIETTSGHSEPWATSARLRAQKFRGLVLRDVNADILRR
ncbi:GAF domain-containing protein [Thiocystis violacea]|uniref:GAF domain-containing protein n=1 Tax=Thiocystis violacea TaxID=13725 RepID=UPI0019060A06|nr:GAF domain-containing protein [Thiocystis violacea]MBK1716164.1 histidine kinase [Thiocystis violacea]